MRQVNGHHLTLLVLAACTLVTSCSPRATPDACEAGRSAYATGHMAAALTEWERESLDQTPKEKLRAVVTCLKKSGLAASDSDAAHFVIHAADASGGRASLYAGMLLLSGAGVPADQTSARRYLVAARSSAPAEADQMLSILEATRAAEPRAHP